MGKQFLFSRSWQKQEQKFRKCTEHEKNANLEGGAYLNNKVKRVEECKNTCGGVGWMAKRMVDEAVKTGKVKLTLPLLSSQILIYWKTVVWRNLEMEKML